MLVVGKNCYTDIPEADQLIKTYFMSNDSIRKVWEELSDEDKEVLILSNTLKYDNDNMLYKGYKVNKNQDRQFPRKDKFGNIINVYENIKLGIIVQGISDYIYSNSEESELVNKCIKSFADGTGAKIEFSDEVIGKVKMNNGMFRNIYDTYFKQYTFFV